MKTRLALSLLVSVAICPIQNISAETMQESISQALATHPSVEAALASKAVTQEDLKEVRSGFFPVISSEITAGRVYGDTSTTRGLSVDRGAAYSGLGEGSIAITQPIFDGFETINRTAAAKARIQSSDFEVLDIRENLAFAAVQAHLAVLQAQATLDKTQSYYDVIQDYLDRIQLLVDEGVADESELAQAKNISLMLKSALTDYEGQVAAAKANYRQIVGREPKSGLVKPSISDVKIFDGVDSAINFARQNHPSLKAGQVELEASQMDIKAERAGYYPELEGELSHLKRDQAEEIGGEVIDSRAVLRMTWDFETGGGQQARVRRKKAEYSEVMAQNNETLRTIEGEIRQAYAEQKTAKDQLDLIKDREVATKDLFEAYKTQFEGARVRLLQVMQAENQVFNAQLESITAEYRYLLSQYAVLASVGHLLETMNGQNLPVVAEEPVPVEIKEAVIIEEPEEEKAEIIQEVKTIEEDVEEALQVSEEVVEPEEAIQNAEIPDVSEVSTAPRVSKRVEVIEEARPVTVEPVSIPEAPQVSVSEVSQDISLESAEAQVDPAVEEVFIPAPQEEMKKVTIKPGKLPERIIIDSSQ